MKNILLLIHDDAGQEARLQAALDLVRALDGHLTCLDTVALPIIIDGYMGAGAAVLIEDAEQRESRHRTEIEARLAREGVAWSWQDMMGTLAECVLASARASDLIVLNRLLDDADAPDMRAVASSVVTHSRALVVAVAGAARGFPVGGKALIAWNGSDAAMATVQRAVPLLGLARAVCLVQVGEPRAHAIPVEEAAAYLSRHDIPPLCTLLPAAAHVAVALRIEAERWGADWIAMGAYGHGRAREALFGGVTRAMLSACNLPLVLGH